MPLFPMQREGGRHNEPSAVGIGMQDNRGDFSLWQIAPCLLVIVLAVMGVHVFVVLIIGTLASGVVGLLSGSLEMLAFSKHVYEGFTSMFEIFLLSMLTWGLVEMVREAGGIQFLLQKVSGAIVRHS